MKKYFKDMSVEEQVNIIMNNDKLREQASENYYEELMYQQEETGKLMLGGEHWKYIDIRDNYNSFYLALKDWHKFIDNVDKDYLSQNGIDLYNEIMKMYDEWGNMVVYEDEDEDRYNQLEEEIENKCIELLKICEDSLHSYETYTDEDLKEEITFQVEENNMYDNLYIEDNDTSKVYQDISYTKTYC